MSIATSSRGAPGEGNATLPAPRHGNAGQPP